ncbi:hypothetical protein BCV72DRAFT_231769 [Rhizopus microsporus var. microsporus]|uniref:Uncharacterized protein n=2 Tax=Rhizopus microsporus TaxID=58291 RepID=A0A2G4SI53_RHIZD|nr:uncharacterized protein RHIMIDRAFT_269322 [Rhizopus microsporus ATCC 52813]ORE04320.1 hypothetical protein BCV72DRAFT_231769 [Rhizopus microsporus var. microsporus]PHZ08444.1 hypothetical protein RHIMIDRAFT_269322 [Rhizopus microsporus ATCC 52813]
MQMLHIPSITAHRGWKSEILANLFTSLREQETIPEITKKESSGLVLAKDIDSGLHVLAEVNDLPPP